MGYDKDEMSAHGFRAMARTLMIERMTGIAPDVIEAQPAHGKSGPLGMAYDRAEFMEQRRQMMVAWADYLDALKKRTTSKNAVPPSGSHPVHSAIWPGSMRVPGLFPKLLTIPLTSTRAP